MAPGSPEVAIEVCVPYTVVTFAGVAFCSEIEGVVPPLETTGATAETLETPLLAPHPVHDVTVSAPADVTFAFNPKLSWVAVLLTFTAKVPLVEPSQFTLPVWEPVNPSVRSLDPFTVT
jgi:hypothetical protein